MEKDRGPSDAESPRERSAPGILRVEAPRSRIVVQTPGEPSSPQPSVDRLSVSFAPEYERERSSWSDAESPQPPFADVPSDVSVRVNVFNMPEGDGTAGGGTPSPILASGQGQLPSNPGNRLSVVASADDEDDYSASMTAILQRRASTRKVKGKRRTSSPYDSDRRRSSVFTTSSGDTAITLDGEGTTQEQIFENIRLHKELLEHVKQQPWEMRRKMKLTQQAKEYVKVHEGELQERLAQSKSTKDIMARFKLLMMRYWQHLKRQLLNLAANMIPWELRIKQIESHFGSVVASYFTFLRWVFWINIVISAILICFVILPEVLAADPTTAGSRKILLPSEEKTASYLSTMWEFEGVLKHSPMFYGYYTDEPKTKEGYPLPLSYFLTGLGVYIYSFVAILRKMAKNSRESKLSEKDDECTFSWKIFTAWDFMIGNPETAFNRLASITMGFKEALLEEKERTKDERNWKTIGLRVLANLLILGLLKTSAYAVVLVVKRSAEVKPSDSWWRQNEITLVLSLITTIFPNIFEFIGMLEHYHPRKQLRWQLARIMILNFLNLYTLIFALFGKVTKMIEELRELRPNETTTMISTTFDPFPFCSDVSVNCTILDDYASYEDFKQNNAVLVFIANLTTLLPMNEITTATNTSLVSTINGSGRFNMTEWWTLVHNLLPKANISQIFNAGNITDYTSESWSEYLDNENYTYWTNQSSVELNETNLWTPENKTALIATLPIIVKLLSAYLATIVPTLTRTTPFFGEFVSGNEFSNVTILPILSSSSSSTYMNITGSTEYFESIETIDLSDKLPKRVKTKKPGIGKGKRNRTEARKPKFKRMPSSLQKRFPYTKTTDPPDEDYTQPDWSKYPGGISYEEDEDNVLRLGMNGNGYYEKSSTRGDIPGESKEDPTSTTTEMPSTTPEVTTPKNLDKFLTNVMAIVTMIFAHNSTKTDEIDYSKVRDFSKWITTLESVVETRKVTSPNWNSTFGTTVKVNMEDKESKKCFITICEDGKTVPPDLNEFLNCTDTFCSLETLLGPKSDNCWIPRSTTTETPPTMAPDVSIKLRKLCWETMFGQELVKLTVMDLIFTVGFILVLDFIRAILVRILNPCWFWDLEKKFPQYGDFKIAENILHLVNNQGMIWMGMFFSPGLPALNLLKLVLLMYIRSWAVMTCNVPHETVFRASRSNNFYFALLLFMLFLCTLPVAFAVVWLEPSWHCGAFSRYEKIYHILTQAILNSLPVSLHGVLDYIASPGVVIPLLILLILIIYYLLSLTGALREANNDLKIQLRRERTEERRKMFKMAGKKKDDTPMGKWSSLLPMMAPKTSAEGKEKRASILTTGKMTGFAGAAKRAALKARQMQAQMQAMEAAAEDDGNATDVDQASLPEDTGGPAGRKSSKNTVTTRKPSCTDSVASTRSEIPVIKISEEEESARAGPSGGQSGPLATDSTAKPIVVSSKKQRVLKALIKAGKDQEGPMSSEKSDLQ